jgi:ABC-type transport system involved in cytochrome bd biosynthesis fused ATPase/permease subunit
LRRIKQRRTTITVAHRLSTVSESDAIIVLDNGAIAEMGSHQELLGKGGLYSRLWARQLTSTSFNDLASADVAATGVTVEGVEMVEMPES